MEQASRVQKESVEHINPGEIARFMASREGWKFLNRIRRYLMGSTIDEVRFYPTEDSITTILFLSDDQYFEFSSGMLSLAVLREQFASAFHRFAVKAKE